MTKGNIVFLSCLAVALACVGCSAGGDGGGRFGSSSSIVSVEPDPMDTGALERGYISTLASEVSTDSARFAVDPSTQGLFSRPAGIEGKAADGMLGVSTLAPADLSQYADIDVDVQARDLGDGRIEVTRGKEIAYLKTFERDGVTHTASISAHGIVSLETEENAPRLIEQPVAGRVLVLSNGVVTVVE